MTAHFERARRGFDEAVTAPAPQPVARNLLSRAATLAADTFTDWRNATGLELADAEKGVKDASEVIYALGRATADDDLLAEYTRDLVALTNELTAIKAEK